MNNITPKPYSNNGNDSNISSDLENNQSFKQKGYIDGSTVKQIEGSKNDHNCNLDSTEGNVGSNLENRKSVNLSSKPSKKNEEEIQNLVIQAKDKTLYFSERYAALLKLEDPLKTDLILELIGEDNIESNNNRVIRGNINSVKVITNSDKKILVNIISDNDKDRLISFLDLFDKIGSLTEHQNDEYKEEVLGLLSLLYQKMAYNKLSDSSSFIPKDSIHDQWNLINYEVLDGMDKEKKDKRYEELALTNYFEPKKRIDYLKHITDLSKKEGACIKTIAHNDFDINYKKDILAIIENPENIKAAINAYVNKHKSSFFMNQKALDLIKSIDDGTTRIDVCKKIILDRKSWIRTDVFDFLSKDQYYRFEINDAFLFDFIKENRIKEDSISCPDPFALYEKILDYIYSNPLLFSDSNRECFIHDFNKNPSVSYNIRKRLLELTKQIDNLHKIALSLLSDSALDYEQKLNIIELYEVKLTAIQGNTDISITLLVKYFFDGMEAASEKDDRVKKELVLISALLIKNLADVAKINFFERISGLINTMSSSEIKDEVYVGIVKNIAVGSIYRLKAIKPIQDFKKRDDVILSILEEPCFNETEKYILIKSIHDTDIKKETEEKYASIMAKENVILAKKWNTAGNKMREESDEFTKESERSIGTVLDRKSKKQSKKEKKQSIINEQERLKKEKQALKERQVLASKEKERIKKEEQRKLAEAKRKEEEEKKAKKAEKTLAKRKIQAERKKAQKAEKEISVEVKKIEEIKTSTTKNSINQENWSDYIIINQPETIKEQVIVEVKKEEIDDKTNSMSITQEAKENAKELIKKEENKKEKKKKKSLLERAKDNISTGVKAVKIGLGQKNKQELFNTNQGLLSTINGFVKKVQPTIEVRKINRIQEDIDVEDNTIKFDDSLCDLANEICNQLGKEKPSHAIRITLDKIDSSMKQSGNKEKISQDEIFNVFTWLQELKGNELNLHGKGSHKTAKLQKQGSFTVPRYKANEIKKVYIKNAYRDILKYLNKIKISE